MNTPQAWDERASLATSWEAALWSEDGQRTRFEAIERHLQHGMGDSLLDFGCGTGSLCDFLPSVDYFGWDWSRKMRERARAEHPDAVILDHSPSEMYDHVICCGTFNLAENWTHEQTWNTVRHLWQRNTRQSLIVSLYRGRDPYSLRYSLDEIADFIWRLSIRKYVVDASFLDNDILVALYK